MIDRDSVNNITLISSDENEEENSFSPVDLSALHLETLHHFEQLERLLSLLETEILQDSVQDHWLSLKDR